jgi:hypothetical protein
VSRARNSATQALPTYLPSCHPSLTGFCSATLVSRAWYTLANDEYVYRQLVERDFPGYASQVKGHRVVWKDTYRFLSSAARDVLPRHGLLFDLAQGRLLWASCSKPPDFSFRFQLGERSVISIHPSDAIRFMVGAHPYVINWQRTHGRTRFQVS